MLIGVPKETAPGERRVALVPDSVARLVKSGHEVQIERGAGVSAFHLDADYEAAGATLAADAAAVLGAVGRHPQGAEARRRRRPRPSAKARRW